MRRPITGPALALILCAGLAATGCDTLRPSTRRDLPPQDEEVETAEIDANGRVQGFTADGRPANAPFFKNNRLTGGLSNQARDIEASLGVK